MSVPVIVAVEGALALLNGVIKAIAANSDTISEEDVDDAISSLEASDRAVTDAIIRARARESE